MRREEIVITVTGKKAVLMHAVPLNTGNAGSYRIKFVIDPEDCAWEDKALSAFFRAVTHAGAVVTDSAAVDFTGIATMPSQLLRERAARLEVGLNGFSERLKETSTNMVNVGPVARGAGGNGFFPAGCDHETAGCAPAPGCRNANMWERLWASMTARFAVIDPFLRKVHTKWPLLRRIGEQDDLPTWDGAPWPGGGDSGMEGFWAVMDPALDRFLGTNHPLVAGDE